MNSKRIGSLAVLGGLLQAMAVTSTVTNAVASAAANQVTIETRGEYRYIYANGIPDHPTGTFPNPDNPNTISTQAHTFRVPLHPQLTDTITPVRPVFGVALNGIPFEPGTAEAWEGDRSSPWRFEALTGFIDLGLDENNAHVQPTGSYHYHGVPTGLLHDTHDSSLHEDAHEHGHSHVMTQLGYAADGFPVYGPHGYSDANDATSDLIDVRSSYQLKAGLRPDGPGGLHDGAFTGDFEYVVGTGDLDECNGRFGVTPEHPEGIYHYYITHSFPYIPRCVKGTPDESFLANARRSRQPEGSRPNGPPPGDRPSNQPGDRHPSGLSPVVPRLVDPLVIDH
ncbi:MAG: YHYH protein [Cyanobacteria bacterium J06621_11]